MTDLAKTEKLYLDDLAVGAEFNSEKYPVAAEEIREFAKNFDPQPFHLDEEAARETWFEGLVASGWHTAAITMRLLVHSVPIADGIIGAGAEITWPRPTRPGDVLNVVSTIVNISPSKSKPDRGIVTIQSHTFNQHGELCQRLIAKVLGFRRTKPCPGQKEIALSTDIAVWVNAEPMTLVHSEVIAAGYRDALFVGVLYGSACKEIVPCNGSNSGSL